MRRPCRTTPSRSCGGLIRFIEEQTGETFDWDAFFRAMKVYNQETEYELQKWEVNRTPYPQMTGETFWIYRMFFYHLSGGMDPHFLDTDRRVNRIMMRGYQQKKPCAPAMRHRCVEWSCPANFYPDFSVWAENCWGINVVASMESLISDIIINTEDPDQALADLARSYQRTTMRKHTKGGYANVLDELWIVCKQYNADMVLMYDQISCKGMDGLRGVFEEQAAARACICSGWRRICSIRARSPSATCAARSTSTCRPSWARSPCGPTSWTLTTR